MHKKGCKGMFSWRFTNISAYLSMYALYHTHGLLRLPWVFIYSVFRFTAQIATDVTVYFKYSSNCLKMAF